MEKVLNGRNAVVTGGGRGIGRGIALALAEEGANVVVNDLGGDLDGTGASKAPADEVVAEIKKKGGKAVPNYDSVAEYESAGRIIKTCVDNFGRIDILVTPAGISSLVKSYEMPPEVFDAMIKVHLYGTFFCAHHASIYMRKQKWGRIIGVSSLAMFGMNNGCHYAAAKAGISGLITSMAIELAEDGITCNYIYPGGRTRLIMGPEGKKYWDKLLAEGKMSKEKYEFIMNDTPDPEFVAPMVVYLASDYGSGINGAGIGSVGGKISIFGIGEERRSVYKDFRKYGPWTVEEMQRVIPLTIEPFARQLQQLKAAPEDYG
jgi:NAD(P)-dependent dehydrogenase (short-subunit alcohol dehydrogenase family)